ncbi:MAG: dihydropteroate synthase [Thermodesulfobacteriota bacterium]
MTVFRLRWGPWSLDLGTRPFIMGVINVTPDSFSDGGDCYTAEAAVAQGLRLAQAGADILDVGGQSTRPGSRGIGEAEEKARVIPVIEGLAARVDIPLSIDTYYASVAQAALEAGAAMVNDISAGRFDPDLLRVCGRAEAPLVLMHMKGRPLDMQVNPVYEDLLGEIKAFLADAVFRAEAAGVRRDRLILDPGIGFGKTFEHNLILLNRLNVLAELGRPLLVGHSRKAFIGHILGGVPPKERDVATAALAALAVYNGAHLIRVHNVELTRPAVTAAWAIKNEHA